MSLFMYDAAYGPPLATLTAHRAAAGSHYMTRSYAGSSFQINDLRNRGLGGLHNWEGMAAELVGASRDQGRAIAREALGAFTPGAPRDGSLAIAYSVDTDVTNLSACDEVFRGINDAHAGTGIKVMMYGEGALILRLHGMGLVQGKQWLSMSEGFGGFWDALRSGLVGIVQMHDAAGNWIDTDIPGTDRNTIIDPHGSGIWWPTNSPYSTAQQTNPPPIPQEELVMARVITVDPKDCARQRIQQLGAFLDTFTGSLRHLGSPEYHFRVDVQKLPVDQNVSVAQYRAAGGR